MAKKITAVTIIICIIIAFILNLNNMSIDKQLQRYYDDIIAPINNCVLYDLDKDEIILEKNIDSRVRIGSMTKMLTAIIAADYLKADDVFIVGEEVDYYLTTDASRSLIKNGQKITFRQLLIAMLVPSGCDAANTIVVNTIHKMYHDQNIEIADAIKLFCEEMNKYAARLGCTGSYFVNPDGQDDERQYSTVADLILIAKKALENDLIREVVSIPKAEETLVSGEKYTWDNTNFIICPDSKFYYEYARGVKTGFTDAAGYCLTSYAEKDGRSLLCIVCNCSNEPLRFNTTIRLFKLGFIDVIYGNK